MIIKILAEGGSMAPGPALSQKLGPAGININQVIQKVNEATKALSGMKVPVEIHVNPSTREFEIRVFSPPVSALLKRELKIEKGSGAQEKLKMANASIEQIISVAKTKMQNLLSKNLKSAVKTVVGTCGPLGVLIENKTPFEIEKEIDEGKYDKEINSGASETPLEKRKELDDFFSQLKAKQEELLKQEEAAKEAAAAAAAAATPAATPVASTPTQPVAAAKPPAKK